MRVQQVHLVDLCISLMLTCSVKPIKVIHCNPLYVCDGDHDLCGIESKDIGTRPQQDLDPKGDYGSKDHEAQLSKASCRHLELTFRISHAINRV